MLRTGYNIAEGSAMIAERIETAERIAETLPSCSACSEVLFDGRCLNIGECHRAHRTASAQSLRRGTAASTRPAAWTLGGRVD
jgi:hypothetical protein